MEFFSRRLKKRRYSGFTAIEAIVATAIFAVVLSGIIGSFAAVMRINSKSRSIRAVEQNARFISELLTREIRNGVVNYGASGYNGTIPSAGRVSTLYLINRNGEAESISLESNAMRFTKAGNATNLSGSDVRISRLEFFIQPISAGDQALITFSYQINSNIGTQAQDQASLIVQSSVAARDY